ncbi:MAG: hypothetical protein ABIE74_08360 [Pseudomonadota bacterium]
MSAKKIIMYAILLVFVGFVVYRVATGAMPLSLNKDVLGLWLSVFFTLSVFSFLYKDNPFYKLAEHIFVGVSAAYWMYMGFWSTIMTNCLPKIFPETMQKILPGITAEKNYLYLISLALGFLLLMRLSKKHNWLSRWALAFTVGYAAGLNFLGYLASDFTTQIRSSIVPIIIFENGSINWGASFSALVLITGVLSSLVYFFYSKEHKGVFGKVSRYGIWVLMVTFGASFAYTVMGRIALLIGRTQFLLNDWLKIGI